MNRDLSAEARSAKVDHLDEAIDRVAARMTAVREDAAMTERIVATLPERSVFGAWLMSAWAPRLAAVALIVIGAALWDRNGIERPAPSQAAAPVNPALVAFAPTVIPVVPVGPTVRDVLLTPEAQSPALDRPDHEFSLPALETTTALGVASIAPRDLPAARDIGLAPIEIGELPLSTDSIYPR